MKEIKIKSKFNDYDIIIEPNLLDDLTKFIDAKRQHVIIHDDMIPNTYVDKVKKACNNALEIHFKAGEHAKSWYEVERIIDILQSNNIKRDSCIIALGGGVTGDLAGFIASIYLRGVDYIQIPTSLVAQIDSSVGGKVAINTPLAKNSVGRFYPPKLVLIDPMTLHTLRKRHFSNGMAEMIKYGMIASLELFEDIENLESKQNIEDLIYKSLMIKKFFVENDEFDNSIRRALNFGHTYGHAYESYYKFHKYLHGEAVALGMVLATESDEVKERLISVLKNYNLPTNDEVDIDNLREYIIKDKKNTQEALNMIFVEEIGKYKIIPTKI